MELCKRFTHTYLFNDTNQLVQKYKGNYCIRSTYWQHRPLSWGIPHRGGRQEVGASSTGTFLLSSCMEGLHFHSSLLHLLLFLSGPMTSPVLSQGSLCFAAPSDMVRLHECQTSGGLTLKTCPVTSVFWNPRSHIS